MSVFFETDAGIAMLEILIPGVIIAAIGCYIERITEGGKRR